MSRICSDRNNRTNFEQYGYMYEYVYLYGYGYAQTIIMLLLPSTVSVSMSVSVYMSSFACSSLSLRHQPSQASHYHHHLSPSIIISIFHLCDFANRQRRRNSMRMGDFLTFYEANCAHTYIIMSPFHSNLVPHPPKL